MIWSFVKSASGPWPKKIKIKNKKEKEKLAVSQKPMIIMSFFLLANV